MGDVDDDETLYPRTYRELPYDREVRERRRGCVPALLAFLVLAIAAVVVAWWLR
jgi:hypothetical protein